MKKVGRKSQSEISRNRVFVCDKCKKTFFDKVRVYGDPRQRSVPEKQKSPSRPPVNYLNKICDKCKNKDKKKKCYFEFQRGNDE